MRWLSFFLPAALLAVVLPDPGFPAETEQIPTDPKIARHSNPDYRNIERESIIEGGPCRAVTMSGALCYAGLGRVLTVFDISNPSNPAKLGDLLLSSRIMEMEANGDHVYILTGDEKLWVVDVSNPSAPSVVAFEIDVTVGPLAAADNHLYHGQGVYGVRILDVSVPSNPVQVGSFPTEAWDVDVQGDVAYVAAYHTGVRILDVSDPAHPAQIAFVATENGASTVDVSGNYAYAGIDYAIEGPAFWVIDVTNPASPSIVGELPPEIDAAADLVAQGSYVYMTNDASDDFLSVVDVSTPASPSVVGSAYVGLSPALALTGDVAVVAAKSRGVRFMDISDPDNPRELAKRQPVGEVYQLALSGEYLAATWYGGWLLMINTADPSEWYYGGVARGYAYPNAVSTHDGLALVTIYDGFMGMYNGLQVFDVTPPSSPMEVSFRPLSWYLGPLDAEGDHAYVKTGDDDLLVVDISNPVNPVQVGQVNTAGDSYAVCANGSHVYLADGDNGLNIVDVSTPSAPFLIGNCALQGSARDVAFAGGYAFVAGRGHAGLVGLWVIDVSDPSDPTVAAVFETNSLMTHITIQDRHAFLTSTEGPRLYMVDISNPLYPREAGYFDAGKILGRVAVIPPRFYAISGTYEEIFVFRYDEVPTGIEHTERVPSVRLEQNFPNPFNPSTTISFALTERSKVNLNIYDARGTRIATLIDGWVPVGEHDVLWDGRDSKGHTVGSGVYFYRLVAGDRSFARKMVFLR